MDQQNKVFPATAMPDRDWWVALWPDPKAVLRSLGVRQGMRALDLCCGDGYFTAPFAQLVGGQIYGVDIDAEMLGQTKREMDRTGARFLDLICADARDLADLVPRDLDYVFIANTFHGVPDKAEMARAVGAVLRPGGYFVIVNWYPAPREDTVVLGKPRGPKTEMRMAPEDVDAIVAPAGFELARVVDLPPYHYGAVFERT